MIKFKIFVVLLLVSSMTFAQKNNVQSAAKAIGLTSIPMSDGSLASGIKLKYDELKVAKQYIDMAAQHPKTANDVKMWYYRGRVYLAIHQQKRTEIDADAIRKATESLIKCIDVDDKKVFKDSASVFLMTAAILCFNEAHGKYGEEKYKEATQLYELVNSCLKYDSRKDLSRNNVSEKTIVLSMYYAANAQGNKGNAKSYLIKLIELNYNDPKVYLFMSRLLQEEKDTSKALEYIEKGLKWFYDDNDLIREQVNLSVKLGRTDELMEKLGQDIEYDAGNSTLYLMRGILYEKNGDQEAAKKDYMEALGLNPGYFIAAYNLGAMFYNDGVEIMNLAKDIVDNAKYAKEKGKADILFKQAIPHLELALEIDPKDSDTAQRLVRLYARTGDDAKYQALKKKMEEM